MGQLSVILTVACLVVYHNGGLVDAQTNKSVEAQLLDLSKELAAYKTRQDELIKEIADLQASTKKQVTVSHNNLNGVKKELESKISDSGNIAGTLVRQVSMQQLFLEERIRSDGNSGIKRTRGYTVGTKPYYSNKVGGKSNSLSIHDHSNLERTPGLGEFIAVLNGVEFRTRHNDYKMVMPSNTSKTYQATQSIPYPDVPPQVLAKKTVTEQITEMREWFRAFKLQDIKIRDYRKYFKPAMCYLEGAWRTSSTKVEEPFDSDRHKIEANTWFDLMDKIDFTTHTGRKNIDENLSFLPTKIIDVINDTIPVFAQWNYRILCHPISFDLPLKSLQVVDELSSRVRLNLRYDQLNEHKVARYRLGQDTGWNGDDREYTYNSLVDRIMKEIPGGNNYGSNIVDDVMFSKSLVPGSTTQERNAAYYYRWSSLQKPDAMGLTLGKSGFSDDNLFVALTTETKVAPKRVEDCFNATYCKTFIQRVTYAVPLEIIYMTPLQTWNPYNLLTNTDKIVNGANTRTGTPSKPYNGTSSQYYYRTPVELFSSSEIGSSPADTNQPQVSVLDASGTVRNVTASGIRILFPSIPGTGIVRQRYPVYPLHEEGSHTYNEVEALKDVLMDQTKFFGLYRQTPTLFSGASVNRTAGFNLVTSIAPIPTPHDHIIDISADDMAAFYRGDVVEKVSSSAIGHNHIIKVSWKTNSGNENVFSIVSCDGQAVCWDGHNSLSKNSN